MQRGQTDRQSDRQRCVDGPAKSLKDVCIRTVPPFGGISCGTVQFAVKPTNLTYEKEITVGSQGSKQVEMQLKDMPRQVK